MKKSEQDGGQPTVTLDDLFTSGGDIQDTELACALKGKISLANNTDRVFIEDTLSAAGTKKKLVAVSLGRHALVRKNLLQADALAKPSEWYAVQVQENPKTVAEELSRLKNKGIFDRTDKGYLVPLWALRKALVFLSE